VISSAFYFKRGIKKCYYRSKFLFNFKKKNVMRAQIVMVSLAIAGFSLAINAQNSNQGLSYIESSSGLSNPEWEGGRSELEFADMDQDGNLDIISIGDHGNPGIKSGEQGLMVFFGDGQGHWSVQMSGEFGYGGIAAGDVNNDGLMDVGYGMHHNYSGTDFGDQLIEVALGDGTGTNWTPWDDGLATNGEDWGMFGTDFADVDNDGDLDIGSLSFGCCAGVHVYLNNFNGTWTHSYGILEGNSDMIFQFGDINNDGLMDFTAGYEEGSAYFGDGAGGFSINDTGLPAAGSLGRYGLSLGDADGDGGMDLAFTNNNGGVMVYTFSEMLNSWVNFSGNLPSSGPFEDTQLADMNMDGHVDLAVYGEGTFRLYLGDGAGNWTADATFTTDDPGSSQAFRVGGDFDHNGRPDIVLLEEKELSWFTYQNILRCYKESSEAILLSIQAVFPHGKELFRPGSVRYIDWVSSVPGSQGTTISLSYSTSGPEGPWTTIVQEIPNNGRHQWTVPQENSANCYIQYSITDGINTHTSVTPAAFAITDGTIGIGDQGTGGQGDPGNMVVWPNPAGDELIVGSRESEVRLQICDLQGRTMAEFQDISTFPFEIDISQLNNGFYILRSIAGDGTIITSKFMKIGR
jgi:hypothetical protein